MPSMMTLPQGHHSSWGWDKMRDHPWWEEDTFNNTCFGAYNQSRSFVVPQWLHSAVQFFLAEGKYRVKIPVLLPGWTRCVRNNVSAIMVLALCSLSIGDKWPPVLQYNLVDHSPGFIVDVLTKFLLPFLLTLLQMIVPWNSRRRSDLSFGSGLVYHAAPAVDQDTFSFKCSQVTPILGGEYAGFLLRPGETLGVHTLHCKYSDSSKWKSSAPEEFSMAMLARQTCRISLNPSGWSFHSSLNRRQTRDLSSILCS